jgi:chromosomal replication initiation ATPase DnaA
MKPTKIIEAMHKLKEAYEALNELLPNDGKQEQFKAVGSDYASDRIIKIVKEVFGVDPFTKGRKVEVIEARFAVRYLLRKHTKRSTKSIAELTNCSTHSTVLSSIEECESMIFTDARYKALITKCEERI